MPDDPGAKSSEQTGERLGYANLLRQVDLFAGLDRVTLAKLAARLQPAPYPSQTIVFRQGDAGDAFYLVAAGSVGVYTIEKTGTAETQVRLLNAGEPFGEMALLTNNPRTATIRAETDCEVLRLERSAFIELVRAEPSVALSIAATLSRRLGGMLDRPGGTEGTAAAPHSAKVQAAAATAVRPRWRPGRTGVALIAAAAIFGLGWMSPPPRGLSVVAWHGLIILLAVLPPLVLDAMLEGVLALLLACAWALSGVTSTAVALSGFASSSWVLVVSVLIIGAAITQTGVLTGWRWRQWPTCVADSSAKRRRWRAPDS